MQYIKSLTIRKETALVLAQFVLLVGIATFAPLIKQQAVTGPIVNATLFIAVSLLGPQSAILVGLIPSLIALSAGLLPAVLAPMVPFIMVGNTILILVFNSLRQRSFWPGVILASFSKFLFLFGTSSLVVNLILREEIAQKAVVMMSWPQFLTALGGGLIAYLFLKKLKTISPPED